MPTRLPIQLNTASKLRGRPSDIYSQSGVYLLQCSECTLKYIGQTGRIFEVRCRGDINAIRTNRPNSKFAQHILEAEHEYDTLGQTTEILHIKKKGLKLKTLERFYIRVYDNQEGSTNERHICKHT